MTKQIFRFITCKDRLPVGTWRLLVVLSIPVTLLFIFPGVIFWIIVHIVLWIREGYDADKGVPINKSNPIHQWYKTSEIIEFKLGNCKKCNSDVGYFNLDDGLCKTCILKISNETSR